MPLYHSSAAVLGFLSSLEAGITFAIGKKFSASQFWDDVRMHDATMIQYVGETCRYLLAAPPTMNPVTGENLDKKHRVRLAFGNGLRPDVWAGFKDRFGIDCISEFYAATETPLGTFNQSRNDFAFGAVGRFGWLGSAIYGLVVAIVEVNYETELPWRDAKTGFCKRARTGQPGELLYRVPNQTERGFQGYYGNPKATNSKLLRDVFRKGDVWVRSGDTIIWDCEGRLYFTDRIGDTFRWKSENVSTAEVGHVVGLHPGIIEANVYGVELPCHEGRAGCAAVALNGNPDEVMMQSIADHVMAGLPAYARPLFLRITDGAGSQTTGTLKHLKHHLREEGVDPAKVPRSSVFWLKGGRYVPFGEKDWALIVSGKARL
jgi:acyl-CoA synthetase (AMP-forming)/AMP-acid ligase II